jgi:hypothetical protein
MWSIKLPLNTPKFRWVSECNAQGSGLKTHPQTWTGRKCYAEPRGYAECRWKTQYTELSPTFLNLWKSTNNDKKGKEVPLRSIEAHLGDRRYSSYSFLTSALEGGEWAASRPDRSLPPQKEPPVPIVQEAGWAPGPVWTQRLEGKSSACVGDRTPAVQSVVRHCTDWATPAQ